MGKEVQMDNLSPISPTLKDAIRPSYRYENLSKKLMKEVKKVMGVGKSFKYSLISYQLVFKTGNRLSLKGLGGLHIICDTPGKKKWKCLN